MTNNNNDWREDLYKVTNDRRNNPLQRFIAQRAVIETEAQIRRENAAPLTRPDISDLITYWHGSIQKEIEAAEVRGAIKAIRIIARDEGWEDAEVFYLERLGFKKEARKREKELKKTNSIIK